MHRHRIFKKRASKALYSIAYIIAAALFSPPSYAEERSIIIGIGTHFAQKKTDANTLIDWSQYANITSFRDEIYWHDLETIEGKVLIQNKGAHALQNIKTAHKSGLHPLLILSYGNKFYDGGSQPVSKRAIDAFKKYAKLVDTETRSISPTIEIWNEWNIGAGTVPKVRFSSPDSYVALVKSTSEALRENGFKGTILGGAVGEDQPDWPWLREAIQMGLLNYVDGISIHLYNHSHSKNKRGAPEFIHRIKLLDESIRPHNHDKSFPIYVTEVGWPNHLGRHSVSQDEAAREAEALLNEAIKLPYLKGIWFYELMDGGDNPFEREHNFGILTRDGKEKPISCAIRHWGKVQSATKWTQHETLKGLSISWGETKDGDVVTRVWPSPRIGETRQKYSVSPPTAKTQRRILRADCNDVNSKGQQWSSDIFPTDHPLTFISKKGSSLPKITITE